MGRCQGTGASRVTQLGFISAMHGLPAASPHMPCAPFSTGRQRASSVSSAASMLSRGTLRAVLLQTLKILETFDLHALGHNMPAYIHTLIEALKLAFADRHAYYGNPKLVDVPIDALLSDAYTARGSDLINPLAALPGMPSAGSPEEFGVATRGTVSAMPGKASAEPESDTSYICVVDRFGNCSSTTPSDGAISGPVISGTGHASGMMEGGADVRRPGGVRGW